MIFQQRQLTRIQMDCWLAVPLAFRTLPHPQKHLLKAFQITELTISPGGCGGKTRAVSLAVAESSTPLANRFWREICSWWLMGMDQTNGRSISRDRATQSQEQNHTAEARPPLYHHSQVLNSQIRDDLKLTSSKRHGKTRRRVRSEHSGSIERYRREESEEEERESHNNRKRREKDPER